MDWNTGPARTITTTVTVAGVARPHESVTWAQDITSDLPAPVTAGGQAAQRTGTVVWSSEGVVTRTSSPWHQGPGWIPTVGDPVTVDVADDQGHTVRVFTGVVDTLEGDAFGARSSKLVGALTNATKTIRLMAQTRGGGLVGEGNYGTFGTAPVWVISETARLMGYHSVPPAPAAAKVILDAPLQGSTYNYSRLPYRNAQLVRSDPLGSATGHPNWKASPEGFGVSTAFLEWTPDTGGGTGAGAVGVSILAHSTHTGDALVRIRHGTDADTYLRVLGNKTVRVSTYVNGTTTTHNLTAPLPAGEGPHRVSAVFRGGSVSVRVAGVEQTVTAPTPAGSVTRLGLEAYSGSCVSGLQVWHPTALTDHHLPAWAPTAKYRHGAGTINTTLAPSVRDEKARDVLQGYAESLLTPVWLDGEGVLQVITGKALHEQSPAYTVDALRDAADLSYRMDLLDHHPTVEVVYAHAHQSNGAATTARTTVWQSSGGEVSPEGPDEEFVDVPDDQEWIGLADPAAAPRLVYENRAAFNSGVGSWWGLSEDITDGTYLTLTESGTQTVETLTPWAWKHTTTYPGADGAAKKAPTSAYIRGLYRETGLPIYRARSLVQYNDQSVIVESGSGAAGSGTLQHDAGKWITTQAEATNLADWLHSMVSTPTPVLEGLRVRFDPRLDIGVKITVNAQGVFGADFEALILSVDHDPASDTTTLVARATRVVGYAPTLESVDYAFIGQSLAYWDTARTGKTLIQVAADPLTV